MRSSILLLVMMLFSTSAGAQDDLSVFSNWRKYAAMENALYNRIAGEAYSCLDTRENALASLNSRTSHEAYIRDVRTRLAKAFGPLPEKTPLNARITATFEHEGIAVENVLFESRPGYQVTASMFRRADIEGKRLPAVLYVCGHTEDGYKAAAYQQVILNLARKGFAVFAIDPAGQGERLQYWDATAKKSLIGGPTSEHSYAGLQMLLVGRTMAASRLWDAIRAVDYMVSRSDIDPARIGVQGRSGGGTMSSYLMAMDDRIAAAAPECYITSFRRLFESIGPQDAEQNLLSQIASGLDHGDFILARAPKPTLVVTTTRDMFSIQGARETVAAAAPTFAVLDAPASMAMIEDDAPHQSTKLNRERVYAFFMKTFGVEGSADDEAIPPIDPQKLQVSQTGQVIASGSRSIHDITLDDAAPVLDALHKARKNPIAGRRAEVVKSARTLSGFEAPAGPVGAVFAGRIAREGYAIEKYIIDAAGSLPLPALLFVPVEGNNHPAVLFVSSTGKIADAADGGLAETLVRQGYVVLLCDLPGFGELTGNIRGDDSVIRGVSYNLVFGAQLIGRSVTGIQAGCAVKAAQWLAVYPTVKKGGIIAISRGIAGPALMHAAAFDASIKAVTFIESPLSWEALVRERYYDNAAGSTIVPLALTMYDLADILGTIAPRPVCVVDPAGGDGKPAMETLLTSVKATVSAFPSSGGSFDLDVTGGGTAQTERLSVWLKTLK